MKTKNIDFETKKAYHVGTMEKQGILYNKYINLFFGGLVLFSLYLVKSYNYLLFHSLAELFSIMIGFGIFIVAWNTRKFQENNYFLFIGVAYAFFSGIDLLHAFSYKGTNIFPQHDSNLPTQLWIAARYLQSISLLLAPLLLTIRGRRLKTAPLITAFGAATALILLAVFYWKIFPDAFIEGSGLTQFKKISEYVISAILAASLFLFYKRQHDFETGAYNLIVFSVVTAIFSELSFTLYNDPYGFFNMVGHYLKIVSFYFIYRAVIVTGLNDPYNFLFRNTKKSEETLHEALKESRQRQAEMQALLDSTQAIIAYKDFGDAAQAIFHSCKNLIGAEGGCIAIRDENNNSGETIFLKSGCQACTSEDMIPKQIRELRALVYQNGQPVFVNEITSQQKIPGQKECAVYKNALLAPIMVGQKTVGILGYTHKATDFNKNDAQIALTFGRLLSISLESSKNRESLQESEERLKRAQEIAHLGSWELDLVNNKLTWSDEVYRIFGLKPQEFSTTYEAFLAAVHPDDRQAVDEAYSDSLREGKDTYEIEHRVVRPTGEIRIVHEKCEHARDEAGKIIRSVGMVQDITRRKKAEAEIAHLASFPRLNISPIAEIDLGGNITYANPALTALFPDFTKQGMKHALLTGINLKEIKESKKTFSREVYAGGRWFKQDGSYVPEANSVRVYNADITERKKAEEEILKLKLGLERSNDAVFITDAHGNFLYTNPAFEKLYGYRKEELVGETPRILKSGVHTQEEYKSLWDDLIAKKRVQIELVNKTKKGHFVTVEASANPIVDEKGKAIGFLAIQRDITERKIIEEALRKSEQKFRDIVETSREGIWLLDADKTITYANQRMAEMLGLEPQELIGKNAFKFYDEKELLPINERRMRGTREKQMVKNDGLRIWVIESMSRLVDEYGNDIGTLEMITDITTRKIAEEKLKAYTMQIEKEKAEDEALLSSIGDAIVAVDFNDKIMFVNRAFEDMTGLAIPEIKGRALEETVMLKDHRGNIVPSQFRPIHLALDSGKKVSFGATDRTFFFEKKDKTTVPLAVTANPIILNGKTIGAISVYRDITKDKEVDRAKTEFVSLASHQLRTPLASISLTTEMLLEGMAGEISREQKKYLKSNYESVKEMTELIEALLNVSRIELGTLLINPEPTDLPALIDDLLKKFEVQTKHKKLKLKKVYDKALPDISVDQKLMRLILDNLISNAIKYTKRGGVEIELAKQNPDVLIKVSDTGCGIPKNQHSEIFKKLFRSDNALKSETKGTGLGLYMVKAACEQYGGKCWFESEEGKGTAFYVTVPLKGMKRKI